MANDIYNVKVRQERAMRRYKEMNLTDGFIDAYKDSPGTKAYTDGMVNGYNNGWVDSAESIIEHIKHLLRHNPRISGKEILNCLNFEGYEH